MSEAAPKLWISRGEEPPFATALAEGRNVVGRGDGCEVCLDDEAVSYEHLELTVRGPSLLANDLDSRNGTVLNGEPMTRTRRVRNGDVLLVGSHRIEVSIPPQKRTDSTVAAASATVKLTGDEREVARALVGPYDDPKVHAGRPATRAEVAEALHISERTVQRRLDALAKKLKVPADAGRERPRLIAEAVLALGLGRED